MSLIPSPARRAQIEEMFETVPEPQYDAERQLKIARAALASAQADRTRLEASNDTSRLLLKLSQGREAMREDEIERLRAVLRAVADAPRMHDVYQTADQFADLRLLARKALGK